MTRWKPLAPRALWVGDSFTAGEGAQVPAPLTYPHLVSARLGWTCHVDAQNGTGFVNDGFAASPECAPLIRRLPDDVRRCAADVVIVDAGRNDAGTSIPVLRQAVSEYLTALRTAYPMARLVLVMPSLVDQVQPVEYRRAGEVLREASAACRAEVIDPAEAGAFEDARRNRGLVCDDGFHPSAAGQAHYADALAALLQREPI
ncbi:MAG: SGNH/GDSL hydrolase family protein [Kineosporiaceae bacterium]